MGNCIFCDIVTGHAPASVVYEDAIVVAFLDLGQINPGHILLVPRVHVSSAANMDETTGAHLFTIGLRMDQAVRRAGVRCEGVNLLLADGAAAGQEVFHTHLHVVPRFKGDALKIETGRPVRPSREDLDLTAKHIRRSYESLRRP